MRPKTKTRIKKTVSWRIVSSAITMGLISFVAGASMEVAGAITIADGLLKMIAFYYHEKIWDRVIKNEKIRAIANKSFSESYRRIIESTDQDT